STALPTATPYTEKAYQDNLKTALQNLESQIGIGEEFLRDYFEVELYRQQLRDIITEDVTSEEEQVWVRHILVSDETTAQEVLDRLENGEDFKELAKEFSIDTATAVRGGDLGWFGKGRMDKAFEKAAFSLDIGEISKPVQSSFGWHIIEALGHEMRPLTEYQYEQKRNQVFNDWIASVRETTDIVINEDWGSYVPVEPVIPDKLLLP
ncbi:MAG: peptidyl-prolyl cis-trans isomerase, partial [Anaerolineales bacterium]|nr:peptidyl-prolyl cis-trans isomerase [Anaerolineales bacterium]